MLRPDLTATSTALPVPHPITLRFHRRLERSYREHMTGQIRRQMRITGALGTAVGLLFALTVYGMPELPDDQPFLFALTVSIALSMAQIALTCVPLFMRWIEPLVLLGTIPFAVAMGYVMWRLPDDWLAAGFGVMLISVLGYCLYTTRHLYAFIQALILTAAFLTVLFDRGIYPSIYGGPFIVSFYFLAINALGLGVMRERDRASRMNFLLHRRLESEQLTAETLLHNTLPAHVASRLRRGETTIADAHPDVSVLFADLQGFTALASDLDAREIVDLLDRLFCRFDRICRQEGVEKIKTIGDAYMAAAGVPHPCNDHADRLVRVAMQMLEAVAAEHRAGSEVILRVGIHSGPVVAGVIGTTKFTYDLWGDTVNVASRMESTAPPSTLQVSAETYARLRGHYGFWPRRVVHPKGKRAMLVYVMRCADAEVDATAPALMPAQSLSWH